MFIAAGRDFASPLPFPGCRGGHVGEFRFGQAVGVEEPRLVTLPCLPCDQERPTVVVAGAVEKPLFLFALVDYYRSNASALFALNHVAEDGVLYNGGARYQPKTDGTRHAGVAAIRRRADRFFRGPDGGNAAPRGRSNTLFTGEGREIASGIGAGRRRDVVHIGRHAPFPEETEESIAPVAADFERFESGECLRKGKERPFAGNTGAGAHWTESPCGGVVRRCLFMHPPYNSGVGNAFALFEPVELPRQWPTAFRCQIGKMDGSDPGDGILFRVAVVETDGKETIVAEKQWIQHAWTPLEADLSRWAGKPVRIKLIADVGPADNSAGDWACWADLRLESAKPVLTATVHETPIELGKKSRRAAAN